MSFYSVDAWFSHPTFQRMVHVEWKKLGNVGLIDKLKHLKTLLKKWNRILEILIEELKI